MRLLYYILHPHYGSGPAVVWVITRNSCRQLTKLRRIQSFGGEGKPEVKRSLGRPGVDGSIILRSSGSGMWGYGLDRAGSG